MYSTLVGPRPLAAIAFSAALFLPLAFVPLTAVSAQEVEIGPKYTPEQIVRFIEENGEFAFAAAGADIDAAKARLSKARAALFPRLTFSAAGQRYQSTQQYRADDAEVVASLEVVQPIYDFGKSYDAIKAERSSIEAAEKSYVSARNTVLLEGLAAFYNLHASELLERAVYEAHSSAYVRWDRFKQLERYGQKSLLDVSEWLFKVEKTRLIYYRERSRNNALRLRLEELTGKPFTGEFVNPPEPPKGKIVDFDPEKVADAVEKKNLALAALGKRVQALRFKREGTVSLPKLEAFANVDHSSRDLRGRNEWAVGARLNWNIFDGGVTRAERSRLAARESKLSALFEIKRRAVRRKAQNLVMNINDSWQQIVSSLARKSFLSKRLLRRQEMYQQERVTDLGTAMIDDTRGESELVRATGAYYVDMARLMVVMGESPAKIFDKNFINTLKKTLAIDAGESFVPKSGSGFGQDDQDKVNKNVTR